MLSSRAQVAEQATGDDTGLLLSGPLYFGRRVEQVAQPLERRLVAPQRLGPLRPLSDPVFLEAVLDDSSKILASVCHGPASFVSATRDGNWLFAGRNLTAFLDDEERQAGFAERAPWLLESRLVQQGARFDAGPAWASHVVVDGNLITGQNPQSAEAAAQAVLTQLAANR